MSASPPIMPAYFRDKKFRLIYMQEMSYMSAGFIQTLDRASPYWSAELNSPPLSDTRLDEMMAWIDSLEQSNNTFRGYDPRRPMPRAYQTQALANDPWTQSGQAAPRITASNYTNSTITLDRLANGAIITAGDYISVYYNPGWLLFRANATVVAAANAAVVPVKPRPSSTLLAGVPLAINYRRACAEFKLIATYDETDSVDSLPVIGIKAVQFIDRTLP